MNTEVLLRQALGEQAAEQRPPGPALADRVLALRRRRRARALAVTAAAAVAGVTLAAGVPLLDTGERDAPSATQSTAPDVQAHPDQSPPRDRLSAGPIVLAAHFTTATAVNGDGTTQQERTYALLDPGTGRYEEDPRWSFVAVAPGARTAAVLERDLPARRIGLLDLTTGQVERWIPVERGIGGLAFSADGEQLLATTYDKHPDLFALAEGDEGDGALRDAPSSRTGFYLIDPANASARWSRVDPQPSASGRDDFAFGAGDTTVRGRSDGLHDDVQQYYDLNGRPIATPAGERYLRTDVGARLSPDGSLAAGDPLRDTPEGAFSEILDARTGERVGEVRAAELLVWVDDRRLIAWERDPDETTEYQTRLVLVTLGSDEVVQLAGARDLPTEGLATPWEPVFATG
ncbi:WD40 repeat domain-containing protein [Streptomyces sp. NPDC004610]|uniref:WD40 repeat domain-containing protein n=1 Tax=unclassified Streptomyces TaxID=2593676 RepID=UPI0033B77D9E